MASLVRLRRYSSDYQVEEAESYRGISWTCLFFSWIVPLCRGDYIAGILTMVLWFAGLTLIVNIFMAIFYNAYHLDMMKKNKWVEKPLTRYEV